MRPFPSCFEPRYGNEAKCKDFLKLSFHSYANKANFHMKSFALSLAFAMRFTAIRKWSIVARRATNFILGKAKLTKQGTKREFNKSQLFVTLRVHSSLVVVILKRPRRSQSGVEEVSRHLDNTKHLIFGFCNMKQSNFRHLTLTLKHSL